MSYLQVLDKINSHDIILASKSPRRQSLLKELGIVFRVAEDVETDETYPPELVGQDIPLYLASKKVLNHNGLLKENSILITADTIVWHNNEMMPKPHDLKDAKIILGKLSGDVHQVFTGVCIASLSKQISFYKETSVYFRELSEAEVNHYVGHFKPLDKAGAYGIQEWIGYVGVEKIEGCFYNVMGLPVQQLYQKLVEFVG